MAAPEKRTFADEMYSMSTALKEAARIASSLKDLHEAEVRSAVNEVAAKVEELRHQFPISKQEGALPHQITQEKHDVEYSSSGYPCLLSREGSTIREDSTPPLATDSLRDQARCVDSTSQMWLKADHYLPKEEMSLSGELQKSDASHPTLEAAVFARQGSPGQASEFGALSPHPSSPDKRSSLRGLHTFAGGMRDIWKEAPQESIGILASRCSVHIVHDEDDDHGRARGSRTFGGSLEQVRAASASFASIALAICQSLRHLACGIMMPAGPMRFFWNIMCLIFIAYDLFAVPMQAFDLEDDTGIQVFEWTLTIWWTLDVYMTFRTGYLVGSRIEMRPRMIAKNYARSWLVCDLVVVVFEWINRFAIAFGSASLLRSSRAMRILRYVKLFRASKIHSFWKALQAQVNSNVFDLCISMTILGGILLLTIHITSCIWYAIGESRSDGWSTYDIYEGEKDIVFWYVTSFRWVVSQFNGRTDMDERRNMVERFFTCTVGVALAVIAQAVFISFITKTMLDLSELVSEKTRRRRVVNNYLEVNPLPPLLNSQVKQCLHDYHDVDQELRKEDEVLAILPNHLQSDVLEEVRAPVLMKHPFFHALPFQSPWIMRRVCRRVVQTVSANKDGVVFDKGDLCERMLFNDKLTATYGNPIDNHHSSPSAVTAQPSRHNLRGSHFRRKSRTLFTGQWAKRDSRHGVDLLENTRGRQPKILPMGSYISEAALWVDWRNQGRLISNEHGILLAVTASKLASELKEHPDAFALAYLHAKSFASELVNQDSDDLSDMPTFQIQLHSPLRLAIYVLSASGLRNADWFLAGKSDPYVVCKALGLKGQSGETRFKTKTIDNTLDPVWNHYAEVLVSWHQVIEFQVWDQDFGKMDTKLGVARLWPEDFAPDGLHGDLQLRDSNGFPAQGSLKVKIEILDTEEPNLIHLWHSQSFKKKVSQTVPYHSEILSGTVTGKEASEVAR